MRKAIMAIALVAAALGLGAGAAQAASPAASCAGIVTSTEAQSAPGFVGEEVRGFAGPGFGEVVVGFAQAHGPSCGE
jgi:hypothetical protein